MKERIETGVDRLVRLISAKGKVSIEAAAKELGVSRLVVTEWAEFLNDENLITVDYSLSKTYLKERELSKKEVEKKSKEYVNKKEAFVRKVDTAKRQIERQSEGFEKIKQEVAALKKSISEEISDVRSELKDLEKYEKLKQSLDQDIGKELKKYESQVAQAHTAIEHENKRFASLLGEVRKEEKHLEEEREHAKHLHNLEQQFIKKGKELAALLDRARKELHDTQTEIDDIEKHLDDLHGKAGKLATDIESVKKKNVESLEAERKSHEEAIAELKDKVMAKAQAAKKAIGANVKEGHEAAYRFEKFFKKRKEADALIVDLDKEKEGIQADLEKLKKAAISFNIASKQDVKTHIKDLEKQYDDLEKRSSKYRKKLTKLTDTILG